MDLAPAASELAAVWKSVSAFLENVEGVKQVNYDPRAGASTAAISQWERSNYPAKLPEDLSAFLQLTDGMHMTWMLDYVGEEIPLGCMHINAIRRIQRVHVDLTDVRLAAGSRAAGTLTGEDVPVMAFDLDSLVMDGQLCLFFRPPSYSAPEVWFRDLARSWHLVAHSFTDYFRLMIMHVGLARWQYVFSDIGLDPATKQWLRLVAPNRLALDDRNRPRGRAGDTTSSARRPPGAGRSTSDRGAGVAQ